MEYINDFPERELETKITLEEVVPPSLSREIFIQGLNEIWGIVDSIREDVRCVHRFRDMLGGFRITPLLKKTNLPPELQHFCLWSFKRKEKDGEFGVQERGFIVVTDPEKYTAQNIGCMVSPGAEYLGFFIRERLKSSLCLDRKINATWDHSTVPNGDNSLSQLEFEYKGRSSAMPPDTLPLVQDELESVTRMMSDYCTSQHVSHIIGGGTKGKWLTLEE